MTRTEIRSGYARKLLTATALGLGMLAAFTQPESAFATLLTTEQGAPAVTTPVAPPAATPPAPAMAPPPTTAAPVVQQQPAAHQQRRAMSHQSMPRRPMASQGFNDPERAARRRAFVGGVIIGIVAASASRRR